MNEFLEQFLLQSIPELARAFVNSLYVGIIVLSFLILAITIASRQRKKRDIEKTTWVKLKADHYQRFHQIAIDFEKLVSDFEYLTSKFRQENSDSLESTMLRQLKDKQEEIASIVDTLKRARFSKDKELFNHGYFNSHRYISHVEKVIKSTTEYLEQHFQLENVINS